MTGYLTTHVLDTARGIPVEGLGVELFRIAGETRQRLRRTFTTVDGRTELPILRPEEFRPGVYELVYHTGIYHDRMGVAAEEPRFLDEIPVRICLSEPRHYHVPLLLSPNGYSTYRGS